MMSARATAMRRVDLRTVVYHAAIITFAFVMIYPLLWMAASSFKPADEIFSNVLSLIPRRFTLDNYAQGWAGFGGIPFITFFRNSLIYSVAGTILVVCASALTAYGFARLNFAGRRFWFVMMLMTLMLPIQVQVIPEYILFTKLGLLNTFWPLLLPRIGGQAFFIFLIMQFIRGIPRELDDAAQIDGCGQFGIFWRIIGTTEGVFVAQPGTPATATDLAGHDVKVLRQANGRLLAGAADGIYGSDDGGSSWRRVGLPDQEVLEVMPAPSDPRLIYAGTRPAALFRSRDGGQTWAEVDSFSRAFDPENLGLPDIPSWPPGARAHTIVVDSTNPRRCMVGIEVGGVVTTEDDGDTWSTVLGRVGRLAEVPNEQRVAGMFGSEDGGRTWRFLWGAMARQYTRPLCIDPRPPNAVTVGTAPSAAPYIKYRQPGGAQGVVYQSTDRGATWRSIGDEDHSPSVAAPLCVIPAPETAGHVLVGTDQGEVWHVAADQSKWTLLVGDLPPVQSVLSL